MGIWNLLVGPISELLDKGLAMIPNPEERQKAKLDLQAQLQSAVLQASQSQLDIDKAEAASPSMFVAGWRPAVGWVCCLGLLWQYFIAPLSGYVFTLIATYSTVKLAPLPQMDFSTLMPLLMAMLGLGTMRTFEKVNGVANANLNQPSDKP
jgi:hypothetical protein